MAKMVIGPVINFKINLLMTIAVRLDYKMLTQK